MKHIKAEDDWEIRLTPDHLVYVSTSEGVKLKATKVEIIPCEAFIIIVLVIESRRKTKDEIWRL